MVSHLSKRDLDELKPQIERIVYKQLGTHDADVSSAAFKCLSSSYDKHRTTKKIAGYIDTRKAEKICDKIYDLLEETQNNRSRKRNNEDVEDVEAKKTRVEDKAADDPKIAIERKRNEIEAKLSTAKIRVMMANAQREIEERKKKFDDPLGSTLVKDKPVVFSVAQQGMVNSSSDLEKAKKIAALQAQIQSKLQMGILNMNHTPKPAPLILDEQGRTVDVTGKAVQLTKAIPTLKANIRAKKREEFKAQFTEKTPADISEKSFFDDRLGAKPAVRNKRALKFHEPGKFQQMADRLRMKAQLEKLQNEISQIAKKTGISSATKLALIAKPDSSNDDVPSMEWWDSVILQDNYDKVDSNGKIQMKTTTITNLVEHPTQMRPPTQPHRPVYMPMFLTKKERKKLRRQNRREAWKEEQEKIRLGLIAPPEPKLRISNLMRVLGTDAVQDPTKIEAHVREQMAKRQKVHEEANAARQLTGEQKREKMIRKLREDTTLGVHVAIYRVLELMNMAKKFKVETNAKQLFMTGCVILFKECCVVVVEGGPKQQKKYKRLMLNRIKWSEDVVNTSEGEQVPNKCVLVWEGQTKTRNFGEIKFKICPTEKLAREHFKKHKVEQYWDLAYSGAVLEQAVES